MVDYYEFLQISPNADLETIHRVYRFLAARLHPDNPGSGDSEQFRLLKAAHDVLSEQMRYTMRLAGGAQSPSHSRSISWIAWKAS